MVPLQRGIGDEEAWPPMAGKGSKSMENVAQRMAINGQKVLLKPGSEEDELPQCWTRNLLTIPKGHCGVCEIEYREDTKDMLVL
jgi:hypothetical protein